MRESSAAAVRLWRSKWSSLPAKNLLGYRDVGSIEHSGPAGGPIQLAAKPNLSQLTDDELQQLRVFALKTLPVAGDRPGTGNAQPS
jgi:hypothetical protein